MTSGYVTIYAKKIRSYIFPFLLAFVVATPKIYSLEYLPVSGIHSYTFSETFFLL